VGGRRLELMVPVPAGVAAGEEITVQLEDRWAAGGDAPGTAAAPAGWRDARQSSRGQAQARPVAAVAIGPEPEPEPAFDRARTRGGGPPGTGAATAAPRWRVAVASEVGGPRSAADASSPSSRASSNKEQGARQQDIAWARAVRSPPTPLTHQTVPLSLTSTSASGAARRGQAAGAATLAGRWLLLLLLLLLALSGWPRAGPRLGGALRGPAARPRRRAAPTARHGASHRAGPNRPARPTALTVFETTAKCCKTYYYSCSNISPE
jgi:hypothetical protein